MIAWAEAYRQRREALQALKKENMEAAEDIGHTGKPHINPLSHDLTADLKPIRERYKGLVWMKEFSLERKREQSGIEKAEAYTLTPQINPRSMSLERGIEDLLKFRRKRDQKVDNKKHQKHQELMEECTFQPMLLACNRRYAIAHQHKVHDRLHADASQRDLNLKTEQDSHDADWKLNNLRRARSRTPPPPDVPPARKKDCPTAREVLRERLQRAGGLERQLYDSPADRSRRERSATSQSRQTTIRFDAEDSPKTPLSRRGPRASATVLPSKDEILTSRKKSARRRQRGGGISAPQKNSSMDKSSGGFSGHGYSPSESDNDESCLRRRQVVPQKSVWTGGNNTIMVTSQFKTLLERCQPGEGESVRSRSASVSSMTMKVDAKQSTRFDCSRLGHTT